MKEGFDRVEKRFEQVDKRFEQVDKRFEQVDSSSTGSAMQSSRFGTPSSSVLSACLRLSLRGLSPS